jgi:hypothetical protein
LKNAVTGYWEKQQTVQQDTWKPGQGAARSKLFAYFCGQLPGRKVAVYPCAKSSESGFENRSLLRAAFQLPSLGDKPQLQTMKNHSLTY